MHVFVYKIFKVNVYHSSTHLIKLRFLKKKKVNWEYFSSGIGSLQVLDDYESHKI